MWAWPILLLTLSLLAGAGYALAVPLWQAPDEPGHFEQAALLARYGWPLPRNVQDPDLERAILDSLARHRFWAWVKAPWPSPLPARLADDPFLARSGRQVGDEPPGYYLPLAILLRATSDLDAQVWIARGYSLALFLLMVAASWSTARELFPHDPFLAPAITAFVGLLPTAAFLGAAVNNDVAAGLVGVLYAWVVVRLGRRGFRPSLAGVLALVAVVGLWTKKTAAFLFPLTVLVVASAAWRARVGSARRGGFRWRRLNAWLLGLVAAALGVGLFLQLPGPEPAAWLEGTLPGREGRSEAAAHSGRYGLRVADDDPTVAERLVQALPVEALAGQEVVLVAFVRSLEGAQTGRLVLIDDTGSHRQVFQVGENWQEVQLRYRVPADATSLRVALGAGTGDNVAEQGILHFDDVHLWAGGRDHLRNGGAEEAAPWAASLGARMERGGEALRLWLGPATVRKWARWHDWLTTLPRLAVEGQVDWPRAALYALLTFAGFWGNFGWLMVPLSAGWYLLLAWATLVAAVGCARWWLRPAGEVPANPAQRWTFGWLACGLALAVIQTFVPMLVRDWQPQGRYLLPALFPAAACFAVGWRAWVPAGRARMAAVGFVAAFVTLNGVCLVGYVIPYFR
ncbi:MAG: DUF2142 domain-containing protein [Anaerolineae bacterium]